MPAMCRNIDARRSWNASRSERVDPEMVPIVSNAEADGSRVRASFESPV
jgi:hypothetical protein